MIGIAVLFKRHFWIIKIHTSVCMRGKPAIYDYANADINKYE